MCSGRTSSPSSHPTIAALRRCRRTLRACASTSRVAELPAVGAELGQDRVELRGRCHDADPRVVLGAARVIAGHHGLDVGLRLERVEVRAPPRSTGRCRRRSARCGTLLRSARTPPGAASRRLCSSISGLPSCRTGVSPAHRRRPSPPRCCPTRRARNPSSESRREVVETRLVHTEISARRSAVMRCRPRGVSRILLRTCGYMCAVHLRLTRSCKDSSAVSDGSTGTASWAAGCRASPGARCTRNDFFHARGEWSRGPWYQPLNAGSNAGWVLTTRPGTTVHLLGQDRAQARHRHDVDLHDA